MKLRAYHNPLFVDGAHVPRRWRFAYADEEMAYLTLCARWTPWFGKEACWSFVPPLEHYNFCETYIVPVNA